MVRCVRTVVVRVCVCVCVSGGGGWGAQCLHSTELCLMLWWLCPWLYSCAQAAARIEPPMLIYADPCDPLLTLPPYANPCWAMLTLPLYANPCWAMLGHAAVCAQASAHTERQHANTAA